MKPLRGRVGSYLYVLHPGRSGARLVVEDQGKTHEAPDVIVDEQLSEEQARLFREQARNQNQTAPIEQYMDSTRTVQPDL